MYFLGIKIGDQKPRIEKSKTRQSSTKNGREIERFYSKIYNKNYKLIDEKDNTQ